MLIILIFILFFNSCSRYYLGENYNFQNIEIEKKIDLSYELIGWDLNDYREDSSEILKTLHLSNKFTGLTSHIESNKKYRLQIIHSSLPKILPLMGEHTQPVSWMPEKKPILLSITLINRMLSFRTLFLIPLVQQNEENICFRLWYENNLESEYNYPIKTISVFGWVALGLRSFDDHFLIKEIYRTITKQWIYDMELLKK